MTIIIVNKHIFPLTGQCAGTYCKQTRCVRFFIGGIKNITLYYATTTKQVFIRIIIFSWIWGVHSSQP